MSTSQNVSYKRQLTLAYRVIQLSHSDVTLASNERNSGLTWIQYPVIKEANFSWGQAQFLSKLLPLLSSYKRE